MTERILRGSPSTLSVTFYGDETAVDADGSVTVTITKADGTALKTDQPTTKTSTGVYSYALDGLSTLDSLTLAWSGEFDGQDTTVYSYAEIVGSRYFTLAELRAYDTALASITKYPTAKLSAARDLVETNFERICGRAFVARYAREYLTGDGTYQLWLSHPEPLRVVSLVVDDVDITTTVDVRRDSDNLRVLLRRDGVWPGVEWDPVYPYFTDPDNILIEYEYGRDSTPLDIKQAALKWAKYHLVSTAARIDERATVMNIPDFGNFQLATPGQRGSYTGIPEVDIVLDSYRLGWGIG